MLHKYFCTSCGRQIQQRAYDPIKNTMTPKGKDEPVLYDLQAILTGSTSAKEHLKELSFYVTPDQLAKYAKDGKDGEVTLILKDVMGIIGNEHNLNIPEFGDLDREALTKFCEKLDILAGSLEESAAQTPESEPESEEMWGFTGEGSTGNGFGTAQTTAVDAKQDSVGDVIHRKILEQSKNIAKSEDADAYIRHDFTVLYALFSNVESISGRFSLITEAEERCPELVCGYECQLTGGKVLVERNARVCGYCKHPIFEHAGIEKHRSVAFIGNQRAGKTSVITALTHFAVNGVQGLDATIWNRNDIEYIDNLTVTQLSPTPLQEQNLKDFSEGYAPIKTRADVEVPPTNFRIEYTTAGGRKQVSLLSLIDIPGELCLPTGAIDTQGVLDRYQVSLACDGYVVCFDETMDILEAGGVTAGKAVQVTCDWIKNFQRERRAHPQFSDNDSKVPVMTLITKSRSLEEGQQEIPVNGVAGAKRFYMFRKEGTQIANYPVTRTLVNNVANAMKNAQGDYECYLAALRCSPYAHRVPTRDDVTQDAAKQEQVHIPEPLNVDRLLKWVLTVSGCIVPETAYRTPKKNIEITPEKLENIQNPESRPATPGQALTRFFLFENTTKKDDNALHGVEFTWLEKKMADIEENLEEKKKKKNRA